MAAPPASISFAASSKQTAIEKVDVRKVVPLDKLLTANLQFKEAFGLNPTEKPFGQTSPPPAKPKMLKQSKVKDGTMTIGACWGLVSTIVDAYNNHHELVLRPDDLWQAIVTQFSFYVNANGEALRDRFVDFQGKRQLVVETGGNLQSCNYEEFAQRMVDENIVQNIKDPTLVNWLLPGFSTTTEQDRVVAALAVMCTLQNYFEYVCCLKCGIPKVTLLGTVEDWKMLREKAEKLLHYDLKEERMSAWHKLLVPVLDHFVLSAIGQADVQFWDTVCNHMGGGSGPSYLSGWVTVFAVFNKEGLWQGTLGTRSMWPVIDTNDLPAGTFAVSVIVDDNGIQYNTKMIAGQVASEVVSEYHGVRPRPDWCIAYTGSPLKVPVDYKHGKTIV